MAGNISEWCLDWYDADFYQICIDSNYCCNPINDNVSGSVEKKVLRGGNYTYPGVFAMSSHRFDTPPFVTTDHMGFRIIIRELLDTKKEILLPEIFALHQNYPNPFNPFTTLYYELQENVLVNITIYDIMGRIISNLVSSQQSAGYKSIQWNAINNQGQPVSAGIYLYIIQAGDFRQTKKMVLLK